MSNEELINEMASYDGAKERDNKNTIENNNATPKNSNDIKENVAIILIEVESSKKNCKMPMQIDEERIFRMKKSSEEVKQKMSNERSNDRCSTWSNKDASACENIVKELTESAKYKEENAALKVVLQDVKKALDMEET